MWLCGFYSTNRLCVTGRTWNQNNVHCTANTYDQCWNMEAWENFDFFNKKFRNIENVLLELNDENELWFWSNAWMNWCKIETCVRIPWNSKDRKCSDVTHFNSHSHSRREKKPKNFWFGCSQHSASSFLA